jgi:hypothetical protein
MKDVLIELAWLTGCFVLSFLATGALVGYQPVLPGGVLDIQMHNTYFVLSWWLALLPLFLAAATPLTLVRAAQARFAQRSTNVVLGALLLVWLLLGALAGFWAWLALHGR